ncbi:Sps22 protein [Maudiozyma humilis]|uniref:Sps22 protein n=1 Tax=Maudiozyma humilis TaxID=51915 RepID=A0AAV5RYX2_MAUHU|nr:Sps22 protein [Kazachstania humilis]
MKVITALPFFLGVSTAFLARFRQIHDVSNRQGHLLPNEDLATFTPPFNSYNKRDSKTNVTVGERVPVKESAFSAPNSFCIRETHYIEDEGDLLDLQRQCNEIVGDLIISPSYDSFVVDLRNIHKIQGSFVVENAKDVARISAPQLNYVTQEFRLHSMTSLVELELPQLKFANSIDWTVLPILAALTLDDKTMVNENIVISDTSLQNIEFFQGVKELDTFNINNNRFLETIKSNVVTINTQLSVHANSRDVELEMPFLESTQNLTIRDTSSIYLPKLNSVDSSFQIIENVITSLDVPELEFVGGKLGVIENRQLVTADFNNLTEVTGGLMIAKNPRLNKINFFESLRQIGGAIHFEGKFSETVLESLKLVKGSVYVESSSEDLDCSNWISPSSSRSIIRGGKVKCISGKKTNFAEVNDDGDIIDRHEEEIDKKPESYREEDDDNDDDDDVNEDDENFDESEDFEISKKGKSSPDKARTNFTKPKPRSKNISTNDATVKRIEGVLALFAILIAFTYSQSVFI